MCVLKSVTEWLESNKLKLNLDKMLVFLVVGSSALDPFLDGVMLSLKGQVLNLGVLIVPALYIGGQSGFHSTMHCTSVATDVASAVPPGPS